MNSELKRVNIRVTDDVYTYFKEKSNNTGVSMSSLMYLALEEYVLQRINLMQCFNKVPGVVGRGPGKGGDLLHQDIY